MQVAKLRVRLCALQPGRTSPVDLPMLADRRQGGGIKATAHMSIKVLPSMALITLFSLSAPGPCLL